MSLDRRMLKRHFTLEAQHAVIPFGFEDRMRWFSENCLRLAELMDLVSIGETESTYGGLGTRRLHRGVPWADALGHAAFFNVIPGLQWTIPHSSNPEVAQRECLEYTRRKKASTFRALPLVNGVVRPWNAVARGFFGEPADIYLFRRADQELQSVPGALRKLADYYLNHRSIF